MGHPISVALELAFLYICVGIFFPECSIGNYFSSALVVKDVGTSSV
jgi:hypothetical protein